MDNERHALENRCLGRAVCTIGSGDPRERSLIVKYLNAVRSNVSGLGIPLHVSPDRQRMATGRSKEEDLKRLNSAQEKRDRRNAKRLAKGGA